MGRLRMVLCIRQGHNQHVIYARACSYAHTHNGRNTSYREKGEDRERWAGFCLRMAVVYTSRSLSVSYVRARAQVF